MQGGFSSDVGEVVGQGNGASFSTFKELVPSRLRFVGTPNFDPLPYLDPAGASVYAHPLKCRVQPEEFEGRVPVVKMHCSFDSKIKLFELLDSCKRLKLATRHEVDPRFASGMFAVIKSLEQDRLIMDSRPANALEVPLEGWIKSLGSAEALTKLYIPEGYDIVGSGSDLRDFYHLFKVSDERARRNVLCGSVPTHLLRHLNCFEPAMSSEPFLYGCLATLAMGDTQAVTLAQTSHLSLALRSGSAAPSNLITLGGPIPRGPDFVGIVIDDYVALSLVPSGAKGASNGAALSKAMETKYLEVGLVSHPEKGFEDDSKPSFWGVDIDGQKGLIRGTLKRAIPLFGILLQVVKLGYVSVDLLQVISGSLISLFLFRRRLFCTLDLVFQCCVGRKKEDIIKMSGALKSELMVCALLIPFACTDMRAQPRGRVCATDASNWGEAGVVTEVDSSVCRELLRHCLSKPTWTKLLPPGKAWERAMGLLPPELELPEKSLSYKMNPLWEILARAFQYRLLFKRKCKRPRHINIGELRAFLKAEVALGLELPRSREIFGLDSQVVLGCLAKGRSSSPCLNRELERTLGDVLGLSLFSETVYFETSRNPADDPTRGQPVRAADMSLPPWWNDLTLGRFEKFDAWLFSEGLDGHRLSGLPSFDELFLAEDAQTLAARGSLDGSPDPSQISAEHLGGVEPAERSPASPTPSSDTQLPGTRERFLHLDSGVAYSSNSFVFNGLFGVVDGTDGEFVMNYFEKIWTKGHVLTGKDFAWPPIAPGFLDLFSGSKGVASWLLRFTDSWVVTYELEDGPDQDLDSEECQKELMRLLALGVFQSWGGGPVCRSFSRAVTPAVRTREHPLGLEDMRISMREKVQQGNKSADWVCSLMEVSLLLGIFFWVENPDGSFMFLLPRWASLVEEWMGELGSWRLDYCRFGAAWRKRTKILTNSCLKPHSTLCSRDHQHIPLRGRSAFHRKSWTLLAQAYPKLVAKTIAGGIATSCGYLEEQKGGFDPSTFAFCQWRRIGEAKNPGPRPARTLELDEVRLIEAKTAQLQGKIWKWFLTWAGESLTPEALESLTRDPMTLSVLIKEFGCHLFKEGKSLYVLRHLVVLVSKQVLGMKPFLGPCWEIINKWEEIEPPRHRTPLPIAFCMPW